MSGSGSGHPLAGLPARRLRAAALLAVTVSAGLAVHWLFADSAATDIAGDALYAVAAYLAVVIVAPRLRAWIAGSIAAGWCVVIEVFQLTGIPIAAGAVFPPATLALGTVFDPRDLLVYVVTIALCTAADAAATGAARLARRRAMLDRATDDGARK